MNSEALREFWKYRELFYFLTWRDVKLRYKQTVLGVLWVILQPLLSVFVFTLFFGKLAKIPSDGTPYFVFYFCGLLPWIYFSATLSNSGNSLISNANLLTKVYFPRTALPASAALSGLVDFFIGSTAFLCIVVYYHILPSWRLLLWPALVIPLVVLSLGVSMFLAALNVRYRDVKYAIPFLIQLWLFVTPVIYPMSIIPESYRVFVGLNPLSGIIEAFRACIEPTKQVDWQLLLISFSATLFIFVLGGVYFRRMERTFADIV